MALNLNDLARDISKLEGGKVNLPIAQIKEVLSWTLYLLGKHMARGGYEAVIEILAKCQKFYRNSKRRERARGKD
jgi:hypothetical protein